MNSIKKKGFTILELLIVISIIAIVATLATGAAMRAMRQGREKRVDAMVKALDMAINTYHAQRGEWPFTVGNEVKNKNNGTIYTCSGEANRLIFTELYETEAGSTGYLDASAFFTVYKGTRKRLSDVPKGARKNLPLGYPNPADPGKFNYFGIQYNHMTDSVKVTR